MFHGKRDGVSIALIKTGFLFDIANFSRLKSEIGNHILLSKGRESCMLSDGAIRHSYFKLANIKNILDVFDLSKEENLVILEEMKKRRSKTNYVSTLEFMYKNRDTDFLANQEVNFEDNSIIIQEDSVRLDFALFEKSYFGLPYSELAKVESAKFSVIIPNDNNKKAKFLYNDSVMQKAALMKDGRFIELKFKDLPDSISGNRMGNYLSLLKNAGKLSFLVEPTNITNGRFIPIKQLIHILLSDRIESFLTLLDSIPALANFSYPSSIKSKIYNILFELSDNRQLVRDTKKVITEFVPASSFLRNCDSLDAIFGIRFLDYASNNGNVFLSVLRDYQPAQITEIGRLLFKLMFLELPVIRQKWDNNFREIVESEGDIAEQVIAVDYNLLSQMKSTSYIMLDYIATYGGFNEMKKNIEQAIELLRMGVPNGNVLTAFNLIYLRDMMQMQTTVRANSTVSYAVKVVKAKMEEGKNSYIALMEYHDELARDYKLIEDELKAEKYKSILSKLLPMSIENEELKIVPPADLNEFVKEGSELGHCVAAYVPRVLTEEEQVFVLRKIEESDTPFFTIGIRDGRITQVQGKGGRKPTEQTVIDFVKEFAKKNKLKYDQMV